ncbi:FAD-binding oxidoreductase [Salinicola avicenniae]|uniref:FAD-binding oxidoreductase n=1 Tax=Salinicola avicenniae TaxID=2916836 RepID=UPI0020747993|nr:MULTISPECIES: pyridoxamine 5'-phosphate oxidase family protein [unclassified Salinicola]
MTRVTTPANVTPFHAGEREAQRRAGVADQAEAAGGFIRDFMPEPHRAFFSQLPFVVLAAGDAKGRPWVTLLEGDSGFLESPDARTLALSAGLAAEDPLASCVNAPPASGMAIGLLGIELATRRRNRLNGRLCSREGRRLIEVQQSFGNCPQYIREREWQRVERMAAPGVSVSNALDADQRRRIATADTFFIGSVHGNDEDEGDEARDDGRSCGFDASHRGGEPGFVRVTDSGKLRFPDYPGNNFFNTLGNLMLDPRVGLLFVDFESGGLLHITGRAHVDWSPEATAGSNARRLVEICVEQVIDRPAALSLRWYRQAAPLSLKVVDKIVESDTITSFCLAADEGSSLPPFQAGQYLPVELTVPGQPGPVRRSYSLSGAPNAAKGRTGRYRISVKREAHGLASRFLHDEVRVGDRLAARAPAGDFGSNEVSCPLVLVSAGVGITPMLAMLHALRDVARDSSDAIVRPVWFVHGARNGRVQAFREELSALTAALPGAACRIFYSAPDEGDSRGEDYDVEGRITADDLLALQAGAEAHYRICGPAAWIADLSSGLEELGVDRARIAFETFGPTG